MSEARPAPPGCGAPLARAAADGLSLAAAPAFAMMALATAVLGAELGSPMSGMAPMYLLMGAFHSGPWLRLIAGSRG